MDEYNELIRQHSQYKKSRDDKYRNESKDRLSTIMKKKVQTTMIGSLSSIEEHFGFLWGADGGNTNPRDLTEEQKYMYDLFQKVREEILDKGNSQARNVDAELGQYDIKWLRYQSSIPVKKEGQND